MKKRGFTLIELMIVVVIIGILAAVAIPKFADMVDKSKEGATKGQLQALRGALTVYYGQNEGWYPYDANTSSTPATTTALSTLVPTFINEIGQAKVPKTSCTDNSTTVYAVLNPAANVNTSGGWAYDGLNTSSTWGTVKVNCSGNDISGNPWTKY